MRLKKPKELDEQKTYAEKTEHRLVRFFLRNGRQWKDDSKQWDSLKRTTGQQQLSFSRLYQFLPNLKPRLEFLQLPKMVRRDLTLAFTRHRDCKLTSPAKRLVPGVLDGLVFNFDGIKGGMIMHVIDLPQDRRSGSMYWQADEYEVRLQRFAEFCWAIRANDSDKVSADKQLDWPHFCAGLAMQQLSEMATKLLSLWMAITSDPGIANEFRQHDLSVEFIVVDGLSYLEISPSTLARVICSSDSTVKRGLAELVDRGIFTRESVGHQRNVYRCSITKEAQNANLEAK